MSSTIVQSLPKHHICYIQPQSDLKQTKQGDVIFALSIKANRFITLFVPAIFQGSDDKHFWISWKGDLTKTIIKFPRNTTIFTKNGYISIPTIMSSQSLPISIFDAPINLNKRRKLNAGPESKLNPGDPPKFNPKATSFYQMSLEGLLAQPVECIACIAKYLDIKTFYALKKASKSCQKLCNKPSVIPFRTMYIQRINFHRDVFIYRAFNDKLTKYKNYNRVVANVWDIGPNKITLCPTDHRHINKLKLFGNGGRSRTHFPLCVNLNKLTDFYSLELHRFGSDTPQRRLYPFESGLDPLLFKNVTHFSMVDCHFNISQGIDASRLFPSKLEVFLNIAPNENINLVNSVIQSFQTNLKSLSFVDSGNILINNNCNFASLTECWIISPITISRLRFIVTIPSLQKIQIQHLSGIIQRVRHDPNGIINNVRREINNLMKSIICTSSKISELRIIEYGISDCDIEMIQNSILFALSKSKQRSQKYLRLKILYRVTTNSSIDATQINLWLETTTQRLAKYYGKTGFALRMELHGIMRNIMNSYHPNKQDELKLEDEEFDENYETVCKKIRLRNNNGNNYNYRLIFGVRARESCIEFEEWAVRI